MNEPPPSGNKRWIWLLVPAIPMLALTAIAGIVAKTSPQESWNGLGWMMIGLLIGAVGGLLAGIWFCWNPEEPVMSAFRGLLLGGLLAAAQVGIGFAGCTFVFSL
jgi:hypothetical protein